MATNLSRSAMVVLGTFVLGALACSSASNSTFGDVDDNRPRSDGVQGDASLGPSTSTDPSQIWANDPPPKWCGPEDSASRPEPPGGSADCPTDKNREGCPCPTAGETAACWPGLRVNRNHGICKDGVAKCIKTGELSQSWGPCEGYVLPAKDSKRGPAACKCFSSGRWNINNIAPCLIKDAKGKVVHAVATYMDGGKSHCPNPLTIPPRPQGGTNWSTDSVEVDCAGHYKLCYELKAGDAHSPKSTDCSVAKVCVEGDYLKAKELQPFPDLPSWTAANPGCATAFAETGGYGEMSVVGKSVECDNVDDGEGGPYIFNRVKYCPTACETNPNGPGCVDCNNGAAGEF